MRDLHYILLALSVTFLLLPVSEVEAQLIPDNTLGKENSLVNPVNSVQRIDGGTIRGSNLFHSFQEFNIGSGKSAYFSNPGNIENILTRVTGKNSSLILGKLGVLGNANLFLINPNGIIFGENAQLDINGSFVGSTADNIKFADGREFNAVNPSANPILTINVPLGLQYKGNGGNIEVRGTATSNLKVPDKKSLALAGGNIKFDGGKLTAPAGGIDLFAVTNGEVSLVNSNGRINLKTPLGIEYGDIEFLNASNIDASGNSGGSIQVRGRNISLKGNSIISTNTDGDGFGKTLNITATELLKISASDLFADVQDNATGTGGDLVVNSKNLIVTDGSILSSSTFGLGNSGNLTIKTINLQVDNAGRIDVTTYDFGNGGNLTIETANLQVYDGAQITAIAFGKGNAGNMEIKANLVELVGFRQSSDIPLKSGLFANALQENGQGGNLNVTANRLVIRDGATINASNFLSFDPDNLLGRAGTGAAGNIDINSPFVLLENQGIITANVNAGDKGNINIQSQNLQLRKGSVISTNAKNSADGGNINIDTNTLVALENSDIAANSEGSFGGRVIINAKGILGTQFQQQLTPQSDITATSSLGASFSGVVDINTIAVDPNSGLIELPQTLTDSSQKIKAGCDATAGNNFVVSPRGGLPQSPDDLFNGSTIYTELNDVIPIQDIASDINDRNHQNYRNRLSSVENKHKNQNKNQIVEATGWVVDGKGDVVLVAKMPQHSQKSPKINSASCNDFSS
ncbi:filamentous hemagglutinin family N-terminal domain protein [Rivularia sp. PCC 7116]|uniref:two-partner secretion domain-containing protein n=1 Tax=Rivularia sp. PCC 7116 TaxID=373994 RepID=UPI00029F05C8|nr:filamentous hemagglutinin N-terminal domain-containing protein [Rivularia sp. PCC 7116]AFY58605.1 filamentous hemagglutinin family N-terminal domain protein [Rivularia sp. PCC 7116]